MKSIGIFLLLCIFCLLNTPVALAQNGAVVTKGETLIGWWDWNGEDVMALHSSDLEAFCDEPGDLIWTDWLEVVRPDGSIKYHERGAYFTRVFYPATLPEDTFDNWCDLWNNDLLLVAEGITHSTFNDNDFDPAFHHPNRRNTWGYTVTGALFDYAGFCDGGMVELNTVRRFLLKKNSHACLSLSDCIFKEVRKGPRLNCPD
jgi:hypothetical protein